MSKNEIDIEKKFHFIGLEFKINKEKILVKDILSHQSGLFRFKEKISNEDLLNFENITYFRKTKS